LLKWKKRDKKSKLKKQYQDDGGRGDLTDEQWEKLRPLLPPQKAWTGQPAADHRRIVNGILWLHRTGAPWRDIPAERYGNHRTISSRFYRWRKAGLWQQLWSNLMQQADVVGRIDWEVHFVDGTIVRAHQHAAGAKGGTQKHRLWEVALVVSALRCMSKPKVLVSQSTLS
jgi:transposase